jgi:very-short-patch-repair endonuclease
VGLVVEVDGGYPARLRACADEHRDRWLRRQGYAVLRLNEELVRRQLPAALALISEQLAAVR